jgi:uncharacterized protein
MDRNHRAYRSSGMAALGYVKFHPKPYTFRIRIESKNHPITAGVEDYDDFDERHLSKRDLDREHLLSVAQDNNRAAAGWWNEFGKARIYYLSLRNAAKAINHVMPRRLLRNAMKWKVQTEWKCRTRRLKC